MKTQEDALKVFSRLSGKRKQRRKERKIKLKSNDEEDDDIYGAERIL